MRLNLSSSFKVALLTSNKLVVVVIYLRVKRVISRLNVLFLILVRSFPGSLLSYWYILLIIVQILWWTEVLMYLE